MSQTLQAVRGMNDILPADAETWEYFEDIVRDWLQSYGYRPIRMPLVEPTPLFRRAIGEVTDIVEKEMYSFEDALNGEHLTLRPEGTASCVRAAIQHNLIPSGGPQRLYYYGPMFRHERPQKGRYRQFHQIGVEALGFAGPDADAELILMCARLWDDLGLEDVALEINSLGSPEERAQHRAALIAYLEQHQDKLDEDGKRRLHTNPLRILDTKNPELQAIVEAAPEARRLPRRRIEGALRGGAGLPQGRRHPVPHQPPPGARPGLLQPHRVRVGHHAPGRAGHDLRRRPLRRPLRAARRQAAAGRGLRDRHRAPAAAVAGLRRRGRASGARRVRGERGRGCPAPRLPRRRDPARARLRGADALRWRQLQVADEEGRRQRGAGGDRDRRGRGRGRRGRPQAAARQRRPAARADRRRSSRRWPR